MPNRPHKASLNNSPVSTKNLTESKNLPNQHGLLSLPVENLTHITSYLDPWSLVTLSLVNSALYKHVKADYTWHRAFLLRFLGISPESNIDSEKALVLRRTESSWRKEYVFRFNLIRRWERCRNTTVAHAPVHSSISSMHLMQSNALLCSSIPYGIVSRSIPLHGKVIKGFLSPTPSGTGLGVGNPNTEFSPNVTACALTSEGGTGKILWGFRNGEIAVMTATRTMDSGTRSAARLVRCKVDEEHEGEVTQVGWDDTNSYLVSAAKDGRIKVWEAKKVRCVWTSQYLFPHICVSVALRTGPRGYMVVATMESGETWIWNSISLIMDDSPSASLTLAVPAVKIPYLVHDDDQDSTTSRAPTSLHVNNSSSSSGLHVFVTYPSRSDFWCMFFEYTSSSYGVAKYDSDEACGVVTALYPCLSSENSDERGFIITGHQLGWITIYPQFNFVSDFTIKNATPLISPIRKFEAHLDGSAVSALAWNGVILVTGADQGSTTIFDACTFSRLRVLSSPINHSRIRGIGGAHGQSNVQQILLSKEKDFIVVSVGDRAMAFKADVLPKNGNDKRKKMGKKKTRGTVIAKGHEKLLFDQLITESIDEHDQEHQYVQKVHGREREHRENLDRLGLDEIEAVEYVLMLSRDEALAQAGESRGHNHAFSDDGVFEGDFDDIPSLPSSSQFTLSSSPPPSPRLPHKESISSLHSTGTPKSGSKPIQTPLNRGSPSTSNQKVQVSPRKRAEPLVAGLSLPNSVSSSFVSSASGSPENASSIKDDSVFPSFRSSASPPSRSTRGSHPAPMVSHPVSSSSVLKAKGAWTKPISSNGGGVGAWRPTAASTSSAGPSTSRGANYDTRGHVNEDMDEDMKLAIELSLKTAQEEARRSRLG
ncbi:hypothetical protein BDP27DRAFT_1416325 [Rhodocollybia butyracea]|uniref:F-box domain-containing protein n=1 Tax=Rhodocollybia butyracea TaxID=206335 RepID=A0A9P5UBT2_9AGAR|nr:hypothetical protein BDP27DRAFT_1416325 [Rhodocollybia butyracea]